jgi:NTP pyrophosphatase (non-canonical NTP hydrolase)
VSITIRELQEQVNELRQAQGWPPISPERRLLFLTSELGEIAREVLKLSADLPPDDAEAVMERLGLELYDLIWNLCDLANLTGIDLEIAFAKKAEINRSRTW